MSLTFGSLFAGIGGFDLGFERAGMVCKWQVEIDPFCRRVLAKHWPDVRRHDDVKTFPPTDPGEWAVDVICGGFPCQDISSAGQRSGITGERSGLYREVIRCIRLLRPRYVVMENVSALLHRGLSRVLGDLAAVGFDAEWHCVPAAAFGAPHLRERVWLVAYPTEGVRNGILLPSSIDGEGVEEGFKRVWSVLRARRTRGKAPADFGRLRANDGLSGRVGEIAAYGNAVVPQVAEWIGRRLMGQATADHPDPRSTGRATD